MIFIAIIIVFTIATSWDYGHSYARWNQFGLPVSVLAALFCYGYVYKYMVPAYRLRRSSWVMTMLAAGFVLIYTSTHFVISKLFISDQEFLAVYRSHRPTTSYGEKSIYNDGTILLGLLIFSLIALALYLFLAYWHSQKHLGNRIKRWWKVGRKEWGADQRNSLTWLHVSWLIFGWVLWLFLNNFSALVKGKDMSWPTSLLMLLPSMLFFYVNLKTNFTLLARNKVVLALLCTLILWGVLLLVKGLWFLFITKLAGLQPVLDGVNIYEKLKSDVKPYTTSNPPYDVGLTLGFFFKNAAYPELIILLTSFIYGYGRRAIQYQQELVVLAENRQKELLKQKALEKEVVDARLQSLKYQINPHFLFNSLNFLYSQALPLSDELARATMLLSKMMRYGLQENSEESKVSLASEVEHMHNFIEFNQLRFSNQLQIDLRVNGVIAVRRIMPLLLITFVENAFKYGELHQADFPLQIYLTVDTEKLLFFVRNKKRKGPKEASTGIGIENIRSRLRLGYPDRHILTISEDDSFYTTELSIKL